MVDLLRVRYYEGIELEEGACLKNTIYDTQPTRESDSSITPPVGSFCERFLQQDRAKACGAPQERGISQSESGTEKGICIGSSLVHLHEKWAYVFPG